MKKLLLMSAILALSLSATANAAALDFTAMADQTVTSIGGVTFSLAGTGELGGPTTDSRYGGGLWNSADGAYYPTNTILKAEFDTNASGIMFDFDNEGSKLTSWSLFDSSNILITTGALSTGFFDLSSYTGVKSIEWNNGGNNWLFALETLTYETSAVPVPAAVWLMGSGLLGLMGFSRKNKKLAA